VIDVTPEGFRVVEMVEGMDLEALRRLSGVPLRAA
jgi:acyl CoA:acetate/3-ketoacid CoA transferase beta subunit